MIWGKVDFLQKYVDQKPLLSFAKADIILVLMSLGFVMFLRVMGGYCINHFDRPHHIMVFVFEQVAMPDIISRMFFPMHDDSCDHSARRSHVSFQSSFVSREAGSGSPINSRISPLEFWYNSHQTAFDQEFEIVLNEYVSDGQLVWH